MSPKLIAITILAAILLAGAAFLAGRKTAEPASSAGAAVPARELDRARPERSTIGDVATTPTPLSRPLVPHGDAGGALAAPPVPALPPHDVPLAQISDELEERARAGDRRAACRLAVDLIRCQELPQMRSMSTMMERSLASDETDPTNSGFRIDFLARTQNRIETLEPMCAGIGEDDARRGFDWLLRAAELGHVPSMAEFARRPAVPFQSYLGELERLRLYRERAPEMAQRALAAGDVSLLSELAQAHLSASGRWGFSALGQLVEKDDATAYAYYALTQRLAPQRLPAQGPTQPQASAPDADGGRGGRGRGRDGRWLPRLMEGISPEDRTRGEALAGEWESRYFAHRPEVPAPDVGERRADPSICDAH